MLFQSYPSKTPSPPPPPDFFGYKESWEVEISRYVCMYVHKEWCSLVSRHGYLCKYPRSGGQPARWSPHMTGWLLYEYLCMHAARTLEIPPDPADRPWAEKAIYR